MVVTSHDLVSARSGAENHRKVMRKARSPARRQGREAVVWPAAITLPPQTAHHQISTNAGDSGSQRGRQCAGRASKAASCWPTTAAATSHSICHCSRLWTGRGGQCAQQAQACRPPQTGVRRQSGASAVGVQHAFGAANAAMHCQHDSACQCHRAHHQRHVHPHARWPGCIRRRRPPRAVLPRQEGADRPCGQRAHNHAHQYQQFHGHAHPVRGLVGREGRSVAVGPKHVYR